MYVQELPLSAAGADALGGSGAGWGPNSRPNGTATEAPRDSLAIVRAALELVGTRECPTLYTALAQVDEAAARDHAITVRAAAEAQARVVARQQAELAAAEFMRAQGLAAELVGR